MVNVAHIEILKPETEGHARVLPISVASAWKRGGRQLLQAWVQGAAALAGQGRERRAPRPAVRALCNAQRHLLGAWRDALWSVLELGGGSFFVCFCFVLVFLFLFCLYGIGAWENKIP